MNNQEPDLRNFSMLDLFRMEVEERAVILNENLLALEACFQDDRAGDDTDLSSLLESLMRAAHTIKGAARIVKIDTAVQIAHGMEDCFVAAQTGKIQLETPQIDVLLESLDWLLSLSQVSEPELDSWLSDRAREIESQLAAMAAIANPSSASGEDDSSNTSIPPTQPPTRERSDSDEPEPTPDGETTGQLILPPSHESRAIVPDERTDIATDRVEGDRSSPVTAPERVVRVSASNLKKLMSLAGESLVEANWLQPFADSLAQLKQHQRELGRILEHVQESSTERSSVQWEGEMLDKARQQLLECQEILGDRLNELDTFSRRVANRSENLYSEVIASHMRPFGDGVKGFARMVRDLARQLGKQVQLKIVGESTPVDRDILEKLEAPLMHMLQNAIAHGIEFPNQRRERGKSEVGTIRLEAFHRAGMLSICVEDDGWGIDLGDLRQAIVAKQKLDLEMVEQLTESELMEFLFLPGFSTAERVTEISGRGVGLDIAKSMVQEVGGILRATARPDRGAFFQFQLPLTLSVIRALLVEISGEPYAFSLTRIERVLTISRDEVFTVENQHYVTVDERNIGLVAAHQVLDLPQCSEEEGDAISIIVLGDRTHAYGLVVDRFLAERDLVVRPLDPRLGKVPDISAAAIMDDGSPVLIVDVADLLRSIDNLISGGKLNLIHQDKMRNLTHRRKIVLVVDDSITVREMERKILENNGYQVDLAVNGMEGWNAVRMGKYDLVISDIDMPRMNGIELVSQIKSHPKLKSIPIIIISYKDREEDRIAGLEAGANYYLTKSSFHDNSLLSATIDLIGR